MTVETESPRIPPNCCGSRSYLVLLVFAAIVGVPVAAIAYGFLKLVDVAQEGVFADLPGRPRVLDAADVVAAAGAGRRRSRRRRWSSSTSPGSGGHEPRRGCRRPAVPAPMRCPASCLAAFVTLVFGAVLGPEAPLIAIGGGSRC